ncbi:uncharacterized protein LOC111019632 [Momordica charantia]|uniref:Uncharacterized protein LOC111019632 n=1 Tax=Momordica charantia TaxID=3673 RepID=A0A6J1DE91_MOMCH|nr:uncharacterized protein LOC111019632 [Momordica charantia]
MILKNAGNESPIPTSSPIQNILPNVSDLDVLIALRKDSHRAFTSRINSMVIPRNIQEALNDSNWKLAVMEEMNALKLNCTWDIVDFPREKKTIDLFTNWMSKMSFSMDIGNNKVCKLKKSLYGLKPSPRAWFERFEKAVTSYGFLQSQADHNIFYKHSGNDKMVVLIVYVDDIILTGNDVDGLACLKKRLASEFQIKNLGTLKYFLGMKFARSKGDLC